MNSCRFLTIGDVLIYIEAIIQKFLLYLISVFCVRCYELSYGNF